MSYLARPCWERSIEKAKTTRSRVDGAIFALTSCGIYGQQIKMAQTTQAEPWGYAWSILHFQLSRLLTEAQRQQRLNAIKRFPPRLFVAWVADRAGAFGEIARRLEPHVLPSRKALRPEAWRSFAMGNGLVELPLLDVLSVIKDATGVEPVERMEPPELPLPDPKVWWHGAR